MLRLQYYLLEIYISIILKEKLSFEEKSLCLAFQQTQL
jgi:hypothetical protein